MKKALALLAVVVTVGLSSMALDAEAKRLGSGKSSGMQRQQTTNAPAAPGNQAGAPGTPAQAAPAAGTAAAAAAPAAAAAATKRSWMGPIAGLAAGLGLAALASHLGFGEAFANMLMIGLLVMAVIAVIGFVMRRRMAAQNPAMAGAGSGGNGMFRSGPQDMGPAGGAPQGGSLIGSRLGGGVAAAGAQAGTFPAGFDAPAFERNAKTQFMAVQTANDAGDLAQLRDYLSPEMLELAREEIAERGGVPQKTEVFGLEAKVLAVAEEADGYIASVHFTGSTRGQHGAGVEDLDEIWHLTKPRTGFGGWVIAGIQQRGA